ncbi:MAG TPA: hypothetical protein ENJ18_04530 [Nannocystis exedens]|nr:hypothetical protein [Nannocystis exedens]
MSGIDSDERVAIQEALSGYLGREVRVREVFAVESQLYTGYLIIVGGVCYFLCARFGRWDVQTEFATADVTGIEVTPSFSTDDLFEVRVLVRGRLHRFKGFDQRSAKAIAGAIEAAGGEAAKVRPGRQAPSARKRLSFSDSLSARPDYEIGAAAQVPSLGFSSSKPSPPPPPPPPPRSSAASKEAVFPTRGTVSQSFAEMMAEVHDDDDDDDDDLDDDWLENGDDSENFEDRLGEIARKEVARRTPTTSAAKPSPQVRPLVRGIIAGFLFPFVLGIAESTPMMVSTGQPELTPYVFGALLWGSVAFSGGLVSLSFGRTVAMLIAGPLAAVAVVELQLIVGGTAFLAGWFVISWVYIISRGGSSSFMKAALVTGGMAMFAGMGADRGTLAIFVGIFWLAHGYLELAELNTAAKAAEAAKTAK